MSELTKALKNYRLAHCLNQQQMSVKIGIGKSNYVLWELGKSQPSPTSLRKIKQALRLSNKEMEKITGDM